MAVKIGNFERELEIRRMNERNENDSIRASVLETIEKVRPFVEDMRDIRDTFRYVKSKDANFAGQLWRWMTYPADTAWGIDLNSYWGVRAKGSFHYAGVTVNVHHPALFFDEHQAHIVVNDSNWKGVDAAVYIKNNVAYQENNRLSTQYLMSCYDSLCLLYTKFPAWRDKFFKCVSNMKV